MSRKTGGGGWIHPQGENSVTVSGLDCRKAIGGLIKQSLTL